MRLRFWLAKAGAVAMEMLIHAGLGFFTVGPLPGVHYPDSGAGPDAQEAWPPGAAHGPYGGGGRTQEPPAAHPERHCASPPSRIERELWAGLGIDVDRAGS
ncbi:DUF6059 family protein [Streptomyces sp. NPDC002688]|uniref:DUF6059 family protein n=1 Tax=Streptomyces sp. NPDC002688 TaxID=3154423 RepID=UPI00331710F6